MGAVSKGRSGSAALNMCLVHPYLICIRYCLILEKNIRYYLISVFQNKTGQNKTGFVLSDVLSYFLSYVPSYFKTDKYDGK